jgi:hypothetical protein
MDAPFAGCCARGTVVPTLAITLALLVSASPGQAQTLGDLAFMSGCWEGPLSRGGTIEEFYSAPTDNLIVGTTRYVRDGQTVMFEFTQITTDDEGILLLPYPRGSASEHPFRLTALDDSLAVFEAPEHDFPKRISYIVVSPDAHIARIDDGTDGGKSQEWRLSRVACPGEGQ